MQRWQFSYSSLCSILYSAHLGKVEREMAKYKESCPWREGLGARSSNNGWMVGRENQCELGSMIHRDNVKNWRSRELRMDRLLVIGVGRTEVGEGWCLVCREHCCGSCGREVNVQKEAERCEGRRYLKCFSVNWREQLSICYKDMLSMVERKPQNLKVRLKSTV